MKIAHNSLPFASVFDLQGHSLLPVPGFSEKDSSEVLQPVSNRIHNKIICLQIENNEQ